MICEQCGNYKDTAQHELGCVPFTPMKEYDPSAFPPFAVTVDLAIFTIRDGSLQVLLIERGDEPFKGHWALPGGFVNPNESAEVAAYRELMEETGMSSVMVDDVMAIVNADHAPLIKVPEGTKQFHVDYLRERDVDAVTIGEAVDSNALKLSRSKVTPILFENDDDVPDKWKRDVRAFEPKFHLEQLKTYSAPKRDPRMRVVSVAHVAFAADMPEPQAGDDAAKARWWPVEDVLGTDPEIYLAFDHRVILDDALERVRSKLEYTTLAAQFVQEPFTLSDLRRVYKIVWGEEPTLANFRRKVLSVNGFVEAVGEYSTGKTGPRALLYKRGDATMMQPAMMRKQGIDEEAAEEG